MSFRKRIEKRIFDGKASKKMILFAFSSYTLAMYSIISVFAMNKSLLSQKSKQWSRQPKFFYFVT